MSLLTDDILEHVLFGAGAVVDDGHDLSNVLVCHQAVRVANIYDGRIGKEFTGQLPHLFGPSSREEKRLARCRDFGHDLSDLRLKPHVKHAVRLIKNHVRNLGEINHATLEEVVEPAGSCNYDSAATAKITQLWSLWRSTVDARRSALDALPKFHGLFLNLGGKLAGGRQNKDRGPVPGILATPVEDMHESGHKKP
jgi:hypothetical protein